MPANGYRDYSNGIIYYQGRNGTYLSATGINQNSGYIIFFSVNNVRTQCSIDHRQASGVRCVPQ